MRMIILVIVAAFGGVGFGKSFVALLGISAVFSATVGALRREPPFDSVLNHWDEMLAYAALFCLASAFSQVGPG